MHPRDGDEVDKSSLDGERGRRACPPRVAVPDRRPELRCPIPVTSHGRWAPPPYHPALRSRRSRLLSAPPVAPLAAARRARRLGPSSTAGRPATPRGRSPVWRPPCAFEDP